MIRKVTNKKIKVKIKRKKKNERIKKVTRVGGERDEDWKESVDGYICSDVFLCDGTIVCHYCFCGAQC